MKPYIRVALLTGCMLAVIIFAGVYASSLFADVLINQYQLAVMLPVLFLGMGFGMKYYRDNMNGGILEGWKAVTMGLVTNLLATLLYGAAVYTFFTLSETALEAQNKVFLEIFDASVNNEQTKQIGELKNTEVLREQIKSATPGVIIMKEMLKSAAFGLVSLMMATLFFKRTPKKEVSEEVPVAD